MRLTGAAHTDQGRVRRENQDAYGLSADLGLYLVADGMGGHAGGKRASEEATRVVTAAIAASVGREQGADRLRAAIERANARIWELGEADPALHGMGTTIVAVLVEGAVAHVAHVGDSRVYRIRGGAMVALTRDHSYVAELADMGVDLADASVRARYSSMLTRAVGVAPSVEVDVASEPLQPGDTLLLCSDGVYRMVPADVLVELVTTSGADLAAACAAIIARANANGGTDNSTVLLLRVDGPAAPRPEPPTS